MTSSRPSGRTSSAPTARSTASALGAKVFGDDPAQRKRLEGIVWPWMRQTMDLRLGALRAQGVPVVVLEAAVLIEADWIPLVDQVWVVTVSPEIAKTRIIERNGLTPEQAQARIDAQLSNDERATPRAGDHREQRHAR